MKIKKVIDITRRIHTDMVIWPGDRSVTIKREALIKNGNVCNLSSIEMGLHTGTHIDAPFHFIDEGCDIASLDISKYIGNAKVFEVKSRKAVTAGDLENLAINENDIILFKTANSNLPEDCKFARGFVYLDESAANYLVSKKVKSVGIDYLAIDKFDSSDHPAHHILLGNNIGIMESLLLKDVPEGEYFLSCLPLKITGVDGSPVRAVLLEIEG
ncbi:MAG: cyclase family protein [Clostridia bacterium]|nr:cyclase family protein [Clostridia bacterium]